MGAQNFNFASITVYSPQIVGFQILNSEFLNRDFQTFFPTAQFFGGVRGQLGMDNSPFPPPRCECNRDTEWESTADRNLAWVGSTKDLHLYWQPATSLQQQLLQLNNYNNNYYYYRALQLLLNYYYSLQAGSVSSSLLAASNLAATTTTTTSNSKCTTATLQQVLLKRPDELATSLECHTNHTCNTHFY